MSSGRGRSWRPAKKRDARKTRRRTVVILVCVLASLAALVIVPIVLPQEPPVRLICLVAEEHVLDKSGLPVATLAPAGVGSDRLDQVFTRLKELNPNRVMKTGRAGSLEELQAVLRPNEKAVIYCALEVVVRYDSVRKSPVLELQNGGSAAVDFEKMLQALAAADTRQSILLLDLVGRNSGLANGKLKDDVLPLIDAAVSDAAINNLVVLCSSGQGQRSWEYVADDNAPPGSSTADGAPAETVSSTFGTFSGTAFAHFTRMAFIKGEAGSAEELFDFVRRNLQSWVEKQYGEQQTVTLLTSKSSSLDRELLAKIVWPSESDFGESKPADSADAADAADAATDDTEGSDEENGEQSTTKADSNDSPAALAGNLTEQWQILADRGEATAAVPHQWMALSANVLGVESALLNGDRELFNKLYSSARRTIDEIEDRVASGAKSEPVNEFAPWLTSPQTSPEPQPELLNDFKDALNNTGAADNPSRVPRNIQRSATAFLDWFVKDLEVMVARPREDREKLISVRARFIQQLNDSGWLKDEWPEEFFTIEEVLRGNDYVWHADAVKPLVELLRLRRSALAIAAGFEAIGPSETSSVAAARPLRRTVWRNVRDDIRKALTKLTAAERWLALGPVGLKMGTQTLAGARSAIDQIRDEVLAQQRLVSIRDTQRTDFPRVVQFIAQQQEEVSLGPSELNSAEALASAAVQGDDQLAQHFPAALLRRPRLEAAHIDAMFALTRNFSQVAVDPADIGHQEILHNYLRRRIDEATTSNERRRLMALPVFGEDRARVVKTLLSGGRQVETSEQQRSGLWLSFWSIRLLQAWSDESPTDLWQLWSAFVDAIRNGDETTQRTARVELASALHNAWSIEHDLLEQAIAPSIFTTAEDARELIAADLSQRAEASDRNRGIYKMLFDRLMPNGSLNSHDTAVSVASEFSLNDANEVTVPVTSIGGGRLYVSRTGVELLNDDTELKEEWYSLNSESIGELRFGSNGGLTQAVDVTLAIANADGIVVDSRTAVINPNGRTTWRVDFLDATGEIQTRRERDLELPPSSRDPKDKTKDMPIPLTVRITQGDGVAKKIRVQCFDADDEPFWSTPHELTLDEGNSVLLPLTAPASEEAPADTKATSVPIDVLNGFRIAITPVGLVGAGTATIEVQPKLSEAREFVVRPKPEYHASTHELEIEVARADRIAALKQKLLPVSVHFSRGLNPFLPVAGTSTEIPNIPPDGHTFAFSFKDGIQRAFVNEELEFGLSVAGIPQAWRWRLTENGVRSMADDDPVVRADVTVANPKEAPSFGGQDEILIGKSWPAALLDVQMHVHGGHFEPDDPQWQLDLRVENAKNKKRTSVLDEPIVLRSRRLETITVSPGKKGEWSFSTNSELYGRSDLRIKDYGLGPGQYKLIAQLRRTEANDDPIEHHTSFVFDETPPEISENDIEVPERLWVTRELSGVVSARDLEAGIQEIKVGMVEGKLRPIRIRGTFSDSGEFTIKPSAKVFPKIARSKKIEYAEGTLYVEVTNKVGLVSKAEKRIIFAAKALPADKSTPKPKAPGTVVFEWDTSTKYKVTLSGADGFKKVMEGSGSVEFADVPPGTYTLAWRTGESTGNGAKPPFEVRSGKTTSLEK